MDTTKKPKVKPEGMKLDATGFEYIEVYGAREHNLKNIDVKIPRNQLVVLTGISGSGKSSLAFDTIYAEGQRRYMESFSAYARSFIGGMERPNVDKINGLSPVISIEQKTTSRNPRSTVGTVTEIYDFLRLLYARAADAYSYVTGVKMEKQTEEQILKALLANYDDKNVTLLAPLVRARKGHYRELFEQVRKQGYTKVRVDGEILDITAKMQVDRYKIHDIELVVDRLKVKKDEIERIVRSISSALKLGKGVMMIVAQGNSEPQFFSRSLMDPVSGIAYDEPAPNLFSFNSPYGACPHCKGLGVIEQITRETIVPDETLSISRGALAPLGEYREIWIFGQIEKVLKRNKQNISKPFQELSDKTIQELLYGDRVPEDQWSPDYFPGVIPYLNRIREEKLGVDKDALDEYTEVLECPECHGDRLKKEALYFRIHDKNIAELASMDLNTLAKWIETVEPKLSSRQRVIAHEVLKEVRKRIGFLLDVGLYYLTLNRSMRTLSGGEAQRIRLATQIGTQLVGVLYILDEPSIGLHQRDNVRLIKALKDLKDLGNTVLVVEHDKDMMLDCDYILDIGPGAGIHGGSVVAQGTPEEFLKQNSTTSLYLSGKKNIEIPATRRKGNGEVLKLSNATGHNLKDVTFSLPLGTFTCITGVSGSGKSSLIHETLYPVLRKHFYNSRKDALPYKSVEGLKHIDKVIEVDQAPIGRTPRSNPATYVEVFGDIRLLYSVLPESKIRGYKPGRFSFNVKSGRCEVCEGGGMRLIEMDFLPDVYVPCDACKGKRYNRETLEIRFKGKSIADVLDMTIDQAVEFFEKQPSIYRKIKTLQDVGLGYLTLGQHAPTLSGGEAQRVKLATELSRKDTGKTLYIFDEPTTGLHFEDIRHLLLVLQQLVDKGNTVLVIEHNLDIIKVADHIIDLGPEGGQAGGYIIAQGTPEKVAQVKESHTAVFLKQELKLK
ncbi:MAG: uvrA [Cytophagaceae bacterium]|jgi:excinuclease ABC subunit A|nr:uvrA [Cytophagaceae bacterium]